MMKIKQLPIFLLLITIVFISCNNANNKTENSSIVIVEKIENIAVEVIEPNNQFNGSIKGNFGGCGYNYTPNDETIELYYPRARELSQINSILKYSGLASNFEIYGASINNAVATIIDNKRYILYDPELLSYTDMTSKNHWSSMSILAHEIGHHLSGHTINSKGSNPKDELEADTYSGF